MAGGKETVRQKMIGMMYLVLTALLALQVSSEIVRKFELINGSLERSNAQSYKANELTMKAIQKELSADTKKADILKKAAAIREKSSTVIAELDKIKSGLIETSGGIDKETGAFSNPNAETEVETFMIGFEGKKNGKGYEMKKMLDEHLAFLKQNSGLGEDVLKPLAVSGSEDEALKKNPEQKSKDFAELNFEATPMVAALAVISQKQNEIARYEAEALKKLKGDIDVDVVKVDKMMAMVRPEARTVAAGTKFKAEVFISAYSSGITPSMNVNGQQLNVQNGIGTLEFRASGGGYDKDGKVKKKITGAIKYRTSSGEEKVLPVDEDYYVVQPVIQVQSAAVQALYANCGNELSIQVPALGADYKPVFSVSGGSHFTGSKIGDLTIVPTGTQVAVTVSSGGSTIGTQNFKVRPVPKPAVKIFSNGRELDTKRGLSAPYPSNLEVRMSIDEGFASLLPKDARFKATSTVVYLVRGSRPVTEIRGDDRINIGGLVGQARPGDRLVIEVKDVKRLNFRGQLIESGVNGSPIVSASLN